MRVVRTSVNTRRAMRRLTIDQLSARPRTTARALISKVPSRRACEIQCYVKMRGQEIFS